MKAVLYLVTAVFLQVWQLPQNLVGLVFGWFLKGKRDLPNPPGISKTIHVVSADNMHGGISLGNFIYGRPPIYKRMLLHEYGHCIQSRILGPFYLPVIGLPSLLWALWWHPGRRRSYYTFFTERWADRLGGVERERPSNQKQNDRLT